MEVVSGAIFVRIRGQVQPSEIRARLLELSGGTPSRKFPACPRSERRREIQAIVEAVSEGPMAVDAQGRITLLNKTAESILNLQGRKSAGQKCCPGAEPRVPMPQDPSRRARAMTTRR